MAEAGSFAVFFRITRKGLGVTLRAFCRQNRFDAGNVSRMERGLVAPPMKEEGLERYAKALKLRKGSESYNRFFDLAAKETGRIPPALLETHAEKLPTLLRQLRSGPGHRNWVTARHLNQWAASLAARSILPQLIRRLTRATGNAVTFVSFPALDQTQRTGPDGVVDAAEHDAFVPLGRSVWEMGVSKKPGQKAEADFAKRRKEKLGFDKKRATYIFVTPQNWPAKQKWVDAKKRLKVWKEVRVYDSANLEEWLEHAPAVDVWLARQLEMRPEGLSDIDEYWDNLGGVTDPALKPSVFLASRKKQVEDMETWLNGPPGIVALESRSPAEAVDFVAAVVRQMTEREVVTVRTVVVQEKNAWQSIARSGAKLVMLAHPDLVLDQETVAEAVRQGHHVVLPVGQAVTDRVFTLTLPRVYRHHLEEALRQSGMDRTEASNYAGKVGGSLAVLKRLLAKVPETRAPAWCSTSEGTLLVPMLLAGAWEDQVEGDRVALARLSGHSYDVVAEIAARRLDIPDPPLKRILSHWSLVSRDDSWFLLAHTILPAHLKQFENVAVEVLGENDPAFDLPPDGRWMANIHGQIFRHSHSLRTGVAETLALLGARSDRLSSSADAPGMAAEVVRRLLEPKDWKRWASLSHDLPFLAEAAPDAFLTAVENDLRSKKPVLPKLFEQDDSSLMFSSFPHAGLLWALEGLAWNRGELPRVSYALANLDELLAGKKSGNSPMTSLVEIYLPSFPQTTAPVDERVAILRNICKRHADTGWRLLLELLPDQMGHSSDIRRPAYRDWALTWKDKGPTTADYNRQVRECSALAVEVAGQDTLRLKDLIEHFENLAVSAGDSLLLRLRSLEVVTMANADRRQFAEALRDKIVKHRRFKDADWAMPEDVLGRLGTVQRHLEPRDAVSRNAWQFNQIWEVIAQDEVTAEAEVMNDRERAISEVIAESGWEGVLAMAAVVKAPDELGFAVGRIGSAKDDGKVLPALLESKEQSLLKFARGYVGGRFLVGGWEWAEKLKVSKWPPAAVAEAAHLFPVTARTWAFAAARGKKAEREYWLKTYRPVTEPEPGVVREAARKLLKYGRPFQAAFVLRMARHRGCEVDHELVAEVLEAGMTKDLDDSERESLEKRRHYVVELIQSLQKESTKESSGIDSGRVAAIEWIYLGLLDGHPAKPVVLHGMLGADPKAFIDLLGAISPADDDDNEKGKEPTEEERERARNAFRLLKSWKLVPGTSDDGRVDSDVLLNWTRRARVLAEERKLIKACDANLGEVIAHSPPEPGNGGWPCIAVRDLLEEVTSDDLERSFEIGIYNKRGAYMKSLDGGGEQERGLAKRYEDWADLCKVDWPRTARSLRRIADVYEREARRADAETELRFT